MCPSLTEWLIIFIIHVIYLLIFQPMEQAPLKHSDVLIMCSLTQTPTSHPDNMIGEFCVNTGLLYFSSLISLFKATPNFKLSNSNMKIGNCFCDSLHYFKLSSLVFT